MPDLSISCAPPFSFRDVVFSHGWLRLPPYHWDAEAETLSRIERLPGGSIVRLELSAAPDGVRLRWEGPSDLEPEVLRRTRWILALDEDFSDFHARCIGVPGLEEAAARGMGRILRCPTVWEDLAKTLFSVNTTWRQTIAMATHLVARYGEPHQSGERTFPTPETIAAQDPAVLQERCRVGYRAQPLVCIARDIAEGHLDLQALTNRALPVEEVERRLLALPGIGPYATGNMLMLLGRYDHLPVDSWFRKTVREAWFGGRAVPDRELVAAFDRYRPYRTLVYLFSDWKGAMRREVWEGQASEG